MVQRFKIHNYIADGNRKLKTTTTLPSLTDPHMALLSATIDRSTSRKTSSSRSRALPSNGASDCVGTRRWFVNCLQGISYRGNGVVVLLDRMRTNSTWNYFAESWRLSDFEIIGNIFISRLRFVSFSCCFPSLFDYFFL
jgi:hypothetical protein